MVKESVVVIENKKGLTDEQLNPIYREVAEPDKTITVNDFVKIDDEDSFLVVGNIDDEKQDTYWLILDGAFHMRSGLLDKPIKTVRELVEYLVNIESEFFTECDNCGKDGD